MKKILSLIVVLLFAVVLLAPRSYAPEAKPERLQSSNVDFKDIPGPVVHLPYGPVNP